MRAPLDNLYRGYFGGQQAPLEFRSGESGSGTTMVAHVMVFNQWTRIQSWYEGDFLERVLPGATKRTIKNNLASIRSQFDHGYDSYIGDKPLGPVERAYEDETGTVFEVPLLDTSYNRDMILPMLQGRLMDGRSMGSVLGASVRMRVIDERWVDPTEPSDYNPLMLPERSIREIALLEGGPVVWPAYAGTTTGVRGLTDHYLEKQRKRSLGDDTTDQERSEQPVDPGSADSHPTETAPTMTLAELRLAHTRLLRR